MAYSGQPNVLFGDNYTFSNNEMAISNIDNPSVSDAEANATTGDFRRILYGLLQDMYTRWMALLPQDRPTKMTYTRNTSPNDATQSAVVTFTLRFTTDDVISEVADE